MNTESYVVRVYRCPGKTVVPSTAPATLVGTVEQPDNGAKRPFHGIDELWDILAHPEPFLKSESLLPGNTQP